MTTEAAAKAGVIDWLKAWAGAIRENNLDKGRQLFSEEASGFGTVTLATNNLNDLVERQWTHVWAATTGFDFDWGQLSIQLSPDDMQAIVQSLWSSTGKDESGNDRQRRGRATLVLTRQSANADWKCTHTHFSLWPASADTPLIT